MRIYFPELVTQTCHSTHVSGTHTAARHRHSSAQHLQRPTAPGLWSCCQDTSTARASPASHSHRLCSDATGSARFYSYSAASPSPTSWTGLLSLQTLLVLELVPPTRNTRTTTLLRSCLWKKNFSLPHCPQKPYNVSSDTFSYISSSSVLRFPLFCCELESRVRFLNGLSVDKQATPHFIICISLNVIDFRNLVIGWGGISSILTVPLLQSGQFWTNANTRNYLLVFWHPRWPFPADVPRSCILGSSPLTATDTGGSTPHVLL